MNFRYLRIGILAFILFILIYSVYSATGDPTGETQSGGDSGGGGGGGDAPGDGVCGATETCATEPACGACCVANQGQSCGSCGGVVLCDGSCSVSTPADYGLACGSCGGTIQCDGSCSVQGSCSPGQTQCINNRYQTCNSCNQWQNAGTDSDGDGVDAQCGDSLCDNAAGVFDSTKTATETACADSLDNDCDGLVDCADSDCDGSINGTLTNQNGQLVSGADISARRGLTTISSSTTNQQGNYLISLINCGSYNLVASHPSYASQTKSNVYVNPQQTTTANFGEESGSSLVLGTPCEADCTFADDNLIHASCDGRNGCTFYDNVSKAACDNSQPGWVRDYNSTHYVTCASGSPQLKIEIGASVSCESGTLVKVTRIVFYNGKPVKLVVAACG